MGNCYNKSVQIVSEPIPKKMFNSASSNMSGDQKEYLPIFPVPSLNSRKVQPINSQIPDPENLELESAKMTTKEKTETDFKIIKRCFLNHSVFNQLSKNTISQIISKMCFYTFGPKAEILTEGKPNNRFFVVFSGKLDVLINGIPSGSLKKGQGLGDISLIHETKNEYSVFSKNSASLWVLKQKDFKQVMRSSNDKRTSEVKQFISRTELFDSFSPGQKENLTEYLISQEFNEGQVLLSKGQQSDFICVVEKGMIRVSTKKREYDLSKGDLFGEQSLIYGKTATYTALKQVKVLCVYKEHISLAFGCQPSLVLYSNTLRKAIKKSQFLNKLTKKQIENIIFSMKINTYQIGHKIIEKGSVKGSKFLIPLKGEISSQKTVLKLAKCFGDEDLCQKSSTKFEEGFVSSDLSEVAEMSRHEFEKAIEGSLQDIIRKNEAIIRAKQVPLLRTLNLSKLEKLISVLGIKEVQPGEYVFNQNDHGLDFFIITEGEVEIVKDGTVVRTLEINDFFGERAILFREKRSAAARARNQVILWVLRKEDFLEIIDSDIQEQLNNRIKLQDDNLQLNNVKILKKLGCGSYGHVFLGLNTCTNTLYALKSVSRKVISKNKIHDCIKAERRILLKVDHPFIVKLVKTLRDPFRIYFILEYIRGSTFFNILQTLKLVTIEDSRFYLACILLILEHLHQRKIVFRDLKPENLMVDEVGYLKAIDFGAAKVLEEKTFTLIGTPQYIAPEVILGKGYGLEADLWSLGIMAYELLTGSVPFGSQENDPVKIYEEILAGLFTFPEGIKKNRGIFFIQQTLNKNPIERKTAEELKNHKVFAGFNWDALICRKVKPPCVPVASFDVNCEFGDLGLEEIFDLDEIRDFSNSDEDENWDGEF